MLIFTERELKAHIGVDEPVIKAIEAAFSSLQTKEVDMPPIMRVDIPENNGEVDVKSAYIPGYDAFCIKMSSGFFDNHKRGLPSGSGMMVLISTETGIPKSVLLDNGYLTDVRTAAAGAVAAKYLAPEKIERVGVIGAGTQARYQMLALSRVRAFNEVRVYAPTRSRVDDFVREMEQKLSATIIPAASAEEVVKESELVVTATPAKAPVLSADWLHPGLHITAMGSDAEQKQELAPEVFAKADRIACDVKAQCFRLGELHHAAEQNILSSENDITEIGEMTTGQKPGRESDGEITVCDLTGTGVQDTAIALLAYERLRDQGVGIRVENE